MNRQTRKSGRRAGSSPSQSSYPPGAADTAMALGNGAVVDAAMRDILAGDFYSPAVQEAERRALLSHERIAA